MGGNEKSAFSHLKSEEENEPVSRATSASLGTSADSDTLDCHSPPDKTLRISATQKMITSKAATNWQSMSTRMGMGAGGNWNNQSEWEWNGTNTRLNLGSEWERE